MISIRISILAMHHTNLIIEKIEKKYISDAQWPDQDEVEKNNGLEFLFSNGNFTSYQNGFEFHCDSFQFAQ
ncbi:hypothetical protein TNCV_4441071 [Trichonephila clavipes]|nr:hypothetical protein TNCV_4441071 [Trichonephila clavipes]